MLALPPCFCPLPTTFMILKISGVAVSLDANAESGGPPQCLGIEGSRVPEIAKILQWPGVHARMARHVGDPHKPSVATVTGRSQMMYKLEAQVTL